MNGRMRGTGVAAALLFLAAAGCTDTTVEPRSTITEANFFDNPASYQQFIAKLYGGLAVTGQQGPHGNADIAATDEGFYNYVRIVWNLNELPTDEAAVAWGDLGIQELNTGLWSPTNGFIVAMYYRIYFQVVLANEFLRQTTSARLDERGHNDPALRAEVQQYRAEARFLRALSYWHGIDFFGNIPLVTESDPIGATPPAQSTRTAIYDYVVAELNAILDSLPPEGASTYGRANRYAALMLLAKVYLNAEVYTGTPHYDDALTAVSGVIAGPYILNPVWRNNFLADNNTSPEIIFPVTSDGQFTRTWGGTTFLVHASCGGSMNAADYGIDGCWWGIRLKPEAYNNYDLVNDTARTNFFYTSGQNVQMASLTNFNDGIAAPKFANVTSTGQPGSHPTFPDTDFPMFRLADAYLMYAEAHLRGGGGNIATALQYVNAIRERAYGNTSGNYTSGTLALDTILAERSRELLWEGHRRTDLIRFGKFTGGSYLWAWKGGVEAGTSLGACRDLFPLPASELVANPNLTQNPSC
jgi:hypothetical protein